MYYKLFSVRFVQDKIIDNQYKKSCSDQDSTVLSVETPTNHSRLRNAPPSFSVSLFLRFFVSQSISP
jgi:hypothetical protein